MLRSPLPHDFRSDHAPPIESLREAVKTREGGDENSSETELRKSLEQKRWKMIAKISYVSRLNFCAGLLSNM